jgi:hypothetical protein
VARDLEGVINAANSSSAAAAAMVRSPSGRPVKKQRKEEQAASNAAAAAAAAADKDWDNSLKAGTVDDKDWDDALQAGTVAAKGTADDLRATAAAVTATAAAVTAPAAAVEATDADVDDVDARETAALKAAAAAEAEAVAAAAASPALAGADAAAATAEEAVADAQAAAAAADEPAVAAAAAASGAHQQQRAEPCSEDLDMLRGPVSQDELKAMSEDSKVLLAGILQALKLVSAVPHAVLSSIQPLLLPILTECMSTVVEVYYEKQYGELMQQQQQQPPQQGSSTSSDEHQQAQQRSSSTSSDQQQQEQQQQQQQQGLNSTRSDQQALRLQQVLCGSIRMAVSQFVLTPAAEGNDCNSNRLPAELVLDAFKQGSQQAMSRISNSGGGLVDEGQASRSRKLCVGLYERLSQVLETYSSKAALGDVKSMAAAMEHIWPGRSSSDSPAAAEAAAAAAAAAGDPGADDTSGSEWSSDGDDHDDDHDDALVALRVAMPQTPADLAGVVPTVAAAAAYYLSEFALWLVPGFSYCLAEESEGFCDNNSLLLPLHRYGGPNGGGGGGSAHFGLCQRSIREG